ncbi:CRISPR-associated ring nuclease [Vandammella animalimorsus]|uniref:CRISPR-associated ring nuclease n=1 Tax=Vandammella animalimorsus TaxID=2029117 RepID=UPI00325B8AE8
MSANTPAPCILLCTLGASWAVIPEIYGWLAPEVLDLYRHHPQRATLDQLRQRHGLHAPTEIWICTTEGQQTQQSLALLHQWHQSLGQPVPLRIWTAAGTDQLATQSECAHIRELTLRVALLASEQARGGQLLLSLAGGRKTMSADLQTAGSLFGAHALLHVVGPDPLPSALLGRSAQEKADLPALFSRPLPADLAQAVMPLVAGSGQRSELLDLHFNGRAIHSGHPAFHLPLPSCQAQHTLAWPLPAEGDTLFRELHQRQQQSHALLGNFLAQIAASEHHENWRSLYRLPPAHIQALRQTRLAPEHLQWLQSLPKADLHRHLGGCLNLEEQKTVAQAIWGACSQAERSASLRHIQPLLKAPAWPWQWPESLRRSATAGGIPASPQERARHCAALLLHASPEQLQQHLFDDTEPRLALKCQHPHGFAAYERPGELTGSVVLGHPAALQPYAQAIVAQARQEGLHYLELRGSPHKYRPDAPEQFLQALRQALQQAGAQTAFDAAAQPHDRTAPRIGFIWILDRRQPDTHARSVQQACQALQHLEGFLLGLDLAGDEGTHHPERLAESFLPAFAACLPITIHAGEGESAQNIWQAAYHLHADRIGHGLTLAEHPQLAARFRNRGICLELCPSSNREVVGFHDPAYPASKNLPTYPLREFLRQGIPLTLCTDNPGISRTSVADEYLAAARMCQDGLSQWEALALMRQAFVHAFLPSAERERLLKHADQRVFHQLNVLAR